MYGIFRKIINTVWICGTIAVGVCAVPRAMADDVRLDSAVLGAIEARSIGPAAMSGRITDIVAVPADPYPRIIYVGTAGGGVWKSTDGGLTFRPIFDDHVQSIGSLALDPQHPDTLWVGTGEINVRNTVSVGDGLYRTRDGGKTWEHLGFRESERIARILVHPRDSHTVYVCVLGHLWDDHPERGVYQTTDGGQTWKRILYVDETTGCVDLEMDPQEPNVLYAAMWQVRRWPWFFRSGGPGSGLYKSTDGGKHWRKIHRGLPKGELGRIEIAIAPSRPNRLYAIVEAKKTALYRSDDMGESWTQVSDAFGIQARPFYLAALQVDPQDYKRVYNPSYTLFVSRDGGKTFDTVMGADITSFAMAVHPDHQALWIHPRNPAVIILGTDGGVYISYDRGVHWRFVTNLPVSQFYHVSVDMRTPYWVCGGLQDNGAWCAPSETLDTGGVRNKHWQNVGGGDGFYAFFDPRDPNIVYYSWQGGHLQRRHLNTGEVRDIRPLPPPGDPPYRFNWNAAVALSPNHPGRVYIGAQFLFRSDDRGDHWEKISPDLTTNDPEKQRQFESGGLTIDNTTAENHCTITSISESPLDSSVIWVCTDDGNLQITRDGGQTWTNVVDRIPGLPPHTWCSHVEASRHVMGRAYVTFDGHRTGDMRTYVYRTDDFGATWVSLVTDELEGYAHVIREDVVNPDLLFLGTEFGLFISIDGGQHWVRFTGKFPKKVAVRDLVVHPRDHDLVIATHGRGIYIVDDITPLRHLTPDLIRKDVAILPGRPVVLRQPAPLQDFPGDTAFAGKNPQHGATITYYLKKRHIFGPLRIEILDAQGEVLRTLPTTKRRGINRVYWDLRLKPPKLPATPGLVPFFAWGPTVPEGTYRVRLVRGDTVVEGALVVRADPLAAHSPADRRARHALVMRLYRMLEDMAFMLDTVQSLRQQVQDRLKDIGTERKYRRLRRELERFQDALQAFQDAYTVKSFIHGQKLRENMIELYSAVVGYQGRPTEAQVQYADHLAEELRAAAQRLDTLLRQQLPAVNRRLRKRGLQELHRLTRAEFEKSRQ